MLNWKTNRDTQRRAAFICYCMVAPNGANRGLRGRQERKPETCLKSSGRDWRELGHIEGKNIRI